MKLILWISLLLSNTSHALPWETWQDIKNLATLNQSTQSLLRSSYCQYNCRFDRTSMGDTRFLRIENGEAVIFEELNPGAITRIWMTSGHGTSLPLDENIHIKFYFDGSITPMIDVPLPDFYNGNTPPFVYPLAADRLISSGGNYSYVPISYAKSLKITLTNAVDYMLWFQINHQRMASDAQVNTFSMTDDFSQLADLLNKTGGVDWASSQNTQTGTTNLEVNSEVTIHSQTTHGWIKSIKILADETYFDDIKIKLTFDDNLSSQTTLREFFAIGQNNGVKTQSMMLGQNNQGQLYSNFPMPFHENVSISLLMDNTNKSTTSVSYEIGIDNDKPNESVGIFGTQLQETCPTTPLVDSAMLKLNKKGKWVGFFSEFSSVGTKSRSYLEGDERVYIDGDTHPTQFGTGTEDFYNGGFYFDQGNFSLALHGSPYSYEVNPTKSTTSAYRFMLTDGIEFQKSIDAKLENGAYGDLEMCTKSTAYFYTKDNDYQVLDNIDLSSFTSIISHAYQAPQSIACSILTANFLDEPSTTLTSNSCQINESFTTFTLENNFNAKHLRLRRLIDNHISNQVADVYVNGVYNGTFSPVPEKPAAYQVSTPDRRWQQESIELNADYSGMLSIKIAPRFNQTNHPVTIFTETKYELLGSPRPDLIYQNSFESTL